MALDEHSSASSILDALNAGVIVLDRDASVVCWNAWMQSASGISESDAHGKTLAELFPGLDLKRLPTAVKAAIESRVSTLITHALNPSLLPLRSRSHRTLLHDITVSPVYGEGSHCCLILINDVTMQTNREQYLRHQQNARYDAVVASAPDVILTMDDQGRIVFANPAAISQFGYSLDELNGMDASTLFESKDDFVATWHSAIEDALSILPRELVAHRKDGSLTHLEASASRWKTTSRFFVTVILRDVNERRRIDAALRASEEQARNAATALVELNQTLEQRVQDRTAQLLKTEEALRQSQKMESIGNLTGGIAHDFNNLLAVISGNLHLLRREVAGNANAELRVKKALDGVARSAKLSQQLLAFARRQPLAPKVINLGSFIDDMEDIIGKAVGEGVTVNIVIAPDLWNTLIDPGNVENALLNLAINARDAMEGQGSLTIEASNASLDADYEREHVEVISGQYVLISVSDTGEGMSAEVISKAFEPFFTTKPEGRGTGLGLSMVYGFVRQSGGHIKIESVLGKGTTVRLYLPRSLQSEEQLVDIEALPVVGGNEMVLVAEDDESVRDTVVALLNDLGYRVLKAKDAESALSIIESGMPIDLLFTDVIMPGTLKATDLARKARERMPHLAVLFTSGYSRDAITHAGRLDEEVELLSKPYSRDALARKLRHVLANSAQRKFAVTNTDSAMLVRHAPKQALSVMVCEDDRSIRDSTVELLRLMGHKATPASDAQTALTILSSKPVDILMTDVGLPDMSGTTLAEQARLQNPEIRVILASGAGGTDVSTAIQAVSLAKPYSYDALAAAITAAMEQRSR